MGDRDDLTPQLGSLLGQLELGLGVGFLRAIRGPNDDISGLVLDCVDRDPRWDYDIDARDDYYAQLLLAAGVDAAAVERLVNEFEPSGSLMQTVYEGKIVANGEWDYGPALPLDVLLRMAVRGSRDAQNAVCRYLAEGAGWQHVLWSVRADYERTSKLSHWRSTVESLGAVLCERFSSATQLRAALEEAGEMQAAQDEDPPWSVWADNNPVLAAAIRESDLVENGLSGPPPDLAALSTEQLLAVDDDRWASDVGTQLEQRTSDEDVRLLITAARDESLPMRGPAIEALAAQQRPEVLEIAGELCDQPTRPRWLRVYMRRALVRLPYEQTRSLAYAWLDSSQTMRRRTAAEILEKHACPEDIPTIRDRLRREGLSRETSDMYVVCDLVTALAAHPDHGPYEELQWIFYEIPYSYGRRFVAAALAATDPAFPQTQAVECLWDCEPEVRTIGISHVDARDPVVRKRLKVMADDWAEDEDVQMAARARLDER